MRILFGGSGLDSLGAGSPAQGQARRAGQRGGFSGARTVPLIPTVRESPKSEANPKSEARKHAALAKRAWIDERQNSEFGFRRPFGFRALGFGLARHAESI
jgi:hypothetical protein